VVGSRSGSLSEVVEEGRTGLLARPLDAVAFADAIGRLSRDVFGRQEMAARATDRVRTHFTLEMVVDRTMEIYKSLWTNGRSPGLDV
jgi:glycosyltransferase involved in cell wall biosynthesis